ncbi:MAG: flippase-like domain-containing protein [Coriobacteriia bacterium]|nr:flippase-like domain-containing protein [Coriobacteriia bacterium]MBN2822706.1 flippase-like domain-containing protein [Coriobacteriia bacterium]
MPEVADSQGSSKGRFNRAASLAQWVSVVASIAFVAWILSTRADDLRAALSLDLRLFVLISLSAIGTFIVNGVELQVLAGKFGNKIVFKDAVLLGLMVTTLNYLPMKAGTVINGLIMRSRHKVRLMDFAALVAGSSVIHLWVGAVAAGGFLLAEAREPVLAGGLLVVPSVVVLALVIWGRRRDAGRFDDHGRRMVRLVNRAVDGMGVIFGDLRLLALEIAINAVLVMLASARMALGFSALSLDVPFGSAVVATALAVIAARLSVIPGGLGFKESGAALGSSAAGVQPTLGLAASVIDRAVTLVWLILLGVPATYYLLRVTGIHLSLSGQVFASSEGED